MSLQLFQTFQSCHCHCLVIVNCNSFNLVIVIVLSLPIVTLFNLVITVIKIGFQGRFNDVLLLLRIIGLLYMVQVAGPQIMHDVSSASVLDCGFRLGNILSEGTSKVNIQRTYEMHLENFWGSVPLQSN